jgi:hypothetical protein
MSVESDARKLQIGALIGYFGGYQIGKRFFVSEETDTSAVFPAIVTAGLGVFLGGYVAYHYFGGDEE